MQATYSAAGVDTAQEEIGLAQLLMHVRKTREFRRGRGIGAQKLDIGYFANVIDIGHDMGVAISTDGVGTKILVAQMMNKYDTVGIDCVAMNVNDILCVGAEPLSMLDYIAVRVPNPRLLGEIGKGLLKGAEIARINIAGGELAQLRDMLTGVRTDYEFDLVGTAIGIVPLNHLITGADIREHDIIVGLRSSGIHSNGFSLARYVIAQDPDIINHHFEGLDKTLGEELLTPTHIYVPEVMDMLSHGLDIKALVHITGGGLLNLNRVHSPFGFVIEYLPEPHAIFSVLQRLGKISEAEMFSVYNMGIGFCVIVGEHDADTAIDTAMRHDVEAYKIGYTVKDKDKKVIIKPRNLYGLGDKFFLRR